MQTEENISQGKHALVFTESAATKVKDLIDDLLL